MIGSIVGFTLFFTFVYPLIFTGTALSWAYFITYTTVNVIAISLSWIYFDRTKCYKNEGNIIAMLGYYLYGHNITHILLIIFRLFFNGFYYFSVFGLNITISGYPIVLLPQTPLSLSLPIAIFTTELVFNVYAIMTGWDEKCKVGLPAICDMYPELRDTDVCRVDDDL